MPHSLPFILRCCKPAPKVFYPERMHTSASSVLVHLHLGSINLCKVEASVLLTTARVKGKIVSSEKDNKQYQHPIRSYY